MLVLEGVGKTFPATQGGRNASVHAVRDVTLHISEGEAFGLVGASGSGKSTLGRMVLRLDVPSTGRILFRGEDVTYLPERQLQGLRRQMQVVFQNPNAALNPRRTVFASIVEPLVVQGMRGPALRRRAADLLEEMGLDEPFLRRYPHELSGGQKQRVGIARALAPDPSLIVLDEPTSALDVSVQAQIMALLTELRRRRGLTYLFISHNIAVVRQLCDRVAVMHAGSLVEQGSTVDVFTNPAHPYTQALLAAMPRLMPTAAIPIRSLAC